MQKGEIEDMLTRLPSQKRINREFLRVWLKDHALWRQEAKPSVTAMPPPEFPLWAEYNDKEPLWLSVYDETE